MSPHPWWPEHHLIEFRKTSLKANTALACSVPTLTFVCSAKSFPQRRAPLVATLRPKAFTSVVRCKIVLPHAVQDALNEHYFRPGAKMRERFAKGGDRLIRVFNESVAMGVFPMSRFATGHGYSVQRLHKVRTCADAPDGWAWGGHGSQAQRHGTVTETGWLGSESEIV